MHKLLAALALSMLAAAIAVAAPLGAPGRVIQAPDKRVTPAAALAKKRVMADAPAPPYLRGIVMIEPDGTLQLIRRKPSGAAAGGFRMAPTGKWDRAFTDAPDNVKQALATVLGYLDQCVIAAP